MTHARQHHVHSRGSSTFERTKSGMHSTWHERQGEQATHGDQHTAEQPVMHMPGPMNDQTPTQSSHTAHHHTAHLSSLKGSNGRCHIRYAYAGPHTNLKPKQAHHPPPYRIVPKHFPSANTQIWITLPPQSRPAPPPLPALSSASIQSSPGLLCCCRCCPKSTRAICMHITQPSSHHHHQTPVATSGPLNMLWQVQLTSCHVTLQHSHHTTPLRSRPQYAHTQRLHMHLLSQSSGKGQGVAKPARHLHKLQDNTQQRQGCCCHRSTERSLPLHAPPHPERGSK